ncbi:DUF6928 family protein [Streptomyces sp. NPDC058751]|uniref:DUF6928 family protein n=1 Tax=Streptomyces sp. NPDC058751 TaxID=3346623 RepID=UPI0036D06D62
MGTKTGLLIYADGEVPGLLRGAKAADLPRTSEMMRRLYPGSEIERLGGSPLAYCLYPPEGAAYAASRPGVEMVCDQRVMIDFPSRLPEHLVAASVGRRLVLHAMHSIVDWFAFAVWEDGRLVRSLSLSPDCGVIEDIGEPLPFELPYWAGDHPVDVVPRPNEDEEPRPLPFHPLDLGEEALRTLCGLVQEDRPGPDAFDPYDIDLHGFFVRDPHGPDPAGEEAKLRKIRENMRSSYSHRLGPDSSLIEPDVP